MLKQRSEYIKRRIDLTVYPLAYSPGGGGYWRIDPRLAWRVVLNKALGVASRAVRREASINIAWIPIERRSVIADAPTSALPSAACQNRVC